MTDKEKTDPPISAEIAAELCKVLARYTPYSQKDLFIACKRMEFSIDILWVAIDKAMKESITLLDAFYKLMEEWTIKREELPND